MRTSNYVLRQSRGSVAVLCVIALATCVLGGNPASAQTSPASPFVSPPVTPSRVYINVRTLPKAPEGLNGTATELKRLNSPPVVSPGAITVEMLKQPAHVQTSLATPLGVTPAAFLNPNPSFEGIGYQTLVPPDPNGAPGLNHYIQILNTAFEIFDKQGNSLAGPTNINQLWSSQPTSPCFLNNEGDPVVLYDHLADRWLISQFALHTSNPSHECVAISQGPDPTAGLWYLYDFAFPFSQDDYPKLGLWPDGYYFSSQRGYNCCGIDVAVFDRANMLNGNPATFQSFHLDPPTVILLPGDLTGPPPPPGTPNLYARPLDSAIFGGSNDRVEIWEFHVDWGNPAASTFTNVATLNTDPFSSGLCNAGDLDDNCVPQPPVPGMGQPAPALLETQAVWPMGPLQYRNFGDHESLVFNHTVNATPSVYPNGQAGVHWYELRRVAGVWSIYQESTFAPDSTGRWMGSVAMDQEGNMALGYSASSSTLFPSIRYVGRLATDPPDLMTTPEVTLRAGDDSQATNGSRWGDYSAMRVDPADGCTFWYTNEYTTFRLAADNSAIWNTHIGAFRFPTCNPADLAITKSASPDPVTAGSQLTYTITVTNNGPANATNVIVKDTLPGGVTFLSTSAVCTSGTIQTGCNIGSLANGASTSFAIQVQVNANLLSNIPASTTNITNTATVSADQLDPDTSNNTTKITTNVIESADLQLSKTCKPDQTAALAGSTAFCTIVVYNAGASDAQNVQVTDNIFASTPFTIGTVTPTPSVFCSATSGTITSGTVSCGFGTIAAGGTATVTVNFSAKDGGDINDTASVTASTPDPNTSNNSASGKVTFVSSADLSITKSSSPNPVVAGTNLTYTISVTNAGPSTATNVVVKDTLPGQVSVVSTAPSVGSCTGGIPGNPLQPLTCTLGSLANGGSASIVVVVKVASSTPNGTILVNNATVASSVADPNNNNNSYTAYTTVSPSADLAIVKTSDKSVYKPSSVVTYTITVTNNGPSDALAVVVTDNLPTFKQATYQSDTGGCTGNATPPTILTCNLGTMPAGTSQSFNIYELINGNRGNVSNTATVASTGPSPTLDPNATNNTSTRTVTVGH
jgi:uncharacterized repeat protein (TIGR01451 family)